MVIMRVDDEVFRLEPTFLQAMKEYFDSIKELMREYPETKRYAVQKEGLPTDGTCVGCKIDRNENGKIKIIQSYIN